MVAPTELLNPVKNVPSLIIPTPSSPNYNNPPISTNLIMKYCLNSSSVVHLHCQYPSHHLSLVWLWKVLACFTTIANLSSHTQIPKIHYSQTNQNNISKVKSNHHLQSFKDFPLYSVWSTHPWENICCFHVWGSNKCWIASFVFNHTDLSSNKIHLLVVLYSLLPPVLCVCHFFIVKAFSTPSHLSG